MNNCTVSSMKFLSEQNTYIENVTDYIRDNPIDNMDMDSKRLYNPFNCYDLIGFVSNVNTFQSSTLTIPC